MFDNFGGVLSVSTVGFSYPQRPDALSTFGYLLFKTEGDIFISNMANNACQLLIEQFQYGRDE